MEKYRSELIKRITDQPASICHEWFQDFTVRGESNNIITWNTDMLIDKGIPISQLRDLCVTLENRQESLGKLN